MSNNNNSNTKEDGRKKRLRREFDTLEKEMGVASYLGKSDSGNLRRNLTRKQSQEQSRKRKLLQKEDRVEYAIMGDAKSSEGSRRLRGSQAAFEDDVIQGSLVFPPASRKKRQRQKPAATTNTTTTTTAAAAAAVDGENANREPGTFVDGATIDDKGSEKEYDGDTEVLSENEDEDPDNNNNFGNVAGGEPGDNDDDDNNNNDGAIVDNNIVDEPSENEKQAGTTQQTPRKRRMYKLPNFRSFKMAQLHGDALAAHARGQPKLAIQKLKQVARNAPSAPQVYSSLGMVYEDMLRECKARALTIKSNKEDSEKGREVPAAITDNADDGNDNNNNNGYFTDPLLAEQCDLAKKAYGSYHAAAILCKRDFALWVRAADAACDIATIHGECGSSLNMTTELRTYHCNEKKRWLQEAQRDYITADKQEPPGIDVPAKLASVHMDLGCLSESLTILTDLTNRKSEKVGKRNEFHSSYKAWMLYSDLMLRIGHECIEWNRGVQTNDNYMFRRWLRKHSKKFDWQERRLQGLCLALEAAAGSKSTSALFDWMRDRLAAATTKPAAEEAYDAGGADKDRWHVETPLETNHAESAEPTKGTDDTQREESNEAALETNHDESAEATEGADDTRKEDSNEVSFKTNHAESAEQTQGADDTQQEDSNEAGLETTYAESAEPTEGADDTRQEDSNIVQDAGETINAQDTSETPSEDSSSDGSIREEEAEGPPVGTDIETREHEPSNEITQFEREKMLVVKKHQTELEDFDKTTADMALDPNSLPAKDRESTRASLVKSHEEAIGALTVEYNDGITVDAPHNGTPNNNSDDVDDDKIIVVDEASLPLSASVKQVCAIGSELMKHLHGLKLYTGVRIVGEAISKYFIERAAMRDKRMERNKERLEFEQRLASNPLMVGPYDQYSDDGDSDDDASTFLSDESDIENDGDRGMLESLRRGILPPELRVLYGLALIGEGGKNFVAAKCIDAIDALEQEGPNWLSNVEGETLVSENPLWELFRRAMTEPLGRTSAYAFLADVLRKAGKEQEWAPHFSKFFRRHLGTLKSVGLSNALLRLEGDLSPYTSFRKNQLLKIILASMRFAVWTADCPVRRNPVNRKPMEINDSTCVEYVVSAISSLKDVIHLVWKVNADGSIPEICTEVVRVSSRCLQWLSRIEDEKLSYSSLKNAVEDSRIVIAFLCHMPSLEQDNSQTKEKLEEIEWTDFPVQAKWQGDVHRPLSLSAYNLSIACNVSIFSGWEPEEFTLKLLRRRHGNKHYGIHIDNQRVAGILPDKLEEAIAHQWDRICCMIPGFPKLNFMEKISFVKEREWNVNERKERELSNSSSPIACYAEDEGVGLYLAFSSLCLRLAESETDAETRDQFLQISLSIILPVSQFCVDSTLWTSDIGGAAASLIGFEEWRHMLGRGGAEAFTGGKGGGEYKQPSRRRRKIEKRIEKKVHRWLEGTGKPTIQNLVTIPASAMKIAWKAGVDAVADDDEANTPAAKACMGKVHMAMTELRNCYTESAIEKSSLQVAVALLDLAAHPACHDPFTCLQHAAMFASQAPKAGTSDMVFRKPIPEVDKCSPLEALIILGRADCLHSIYFPNEAAFLCSFVAKVCRLHRDRERPEYEWNDSWKIIAIYGFNVSVMIRTTVSTVLDKQMQKSFHTMWGRDVVEELERGRSDAWAWKRNIRRRNKTLNPQNGQEDVSDSNGQEDNYDSNEQEDNYDSNEQEDNYDSDEMEVDEEENGNKVSIENAAGGYSDEEADDSDEENHNRGDMDRVGGDHVDPYSIAANYPNQPEESNDLSNITCAHGGMDESLLEGIDAVPV